MLVYTYINQFNAKVIDPALDTEGLLGKEIGSSVLLIRKYGIFKNLTLIIVMPRESFDNDFSFFVLSK